jgi:hypothetical protein
VKAVGLGAGLTAVVTAGLVLAWGRVALVPGIVFGLLATAIEVGALKAFRADWRDNTASMVKAFGKGFGLRILGITVLVAAILLDRPLFPPLASAIGFLGVLVPLLFLEPRSVR